MEDRTGSKDFSGRRISKLQFPEPYEKGPIPCLLRWRDMLLHGEVVDLSVDGAMMTNLELIPPSDSLVILAFLDTAGSRVMLISSLISRVIRTPLHPVKDQNGEWIAVRFEEPEENVKLELKAFSVTANP